MMFLKWSQLVMLMWSPHPNLRTNDSDQVEHSLLFNKSKHSLAVIY